jgi:hypothetical protein
MRNKGFRSGDPAPRHSLYEELNVFGAATGKVIISVPGESFPGAPRGFSWRALAELSVAELRAKAAQYRVMAATATTTEVRDSLRKLAERMDAMANRQELGGRES